MLTFFGAAITLMRPLNCLLAALSVGVGALTTGMGSVMLDAGAVAVDVTTVTASVDTRHPLVAVAVAALAAALLTGAGNVVNDLLDIEEDRINQPHRPLPAATISPGATLGLSVTLAVTGLVMAWWVAFATGILATIVTTGLVAYSFWLKRTGPAGNLLVAAMAAVTFPYGAWAIANTGRAWIPALFAFLYHLGRELVKGIQDMPGDRQRHIRTWALRYGTSSAARAAAVCFGTVALLALGPWIAGIYSAAYGIIVVGLDLLLLSWIRQLWRGQVTPRLSSHLLIGMILGLLAICVGELTTPGNLAAP